MTTGQEHAEAGDERSQLAWNSSTRLPQRRHTAATSAKSKEKQKQNASRPTRRTRIASHAQTTQGNEECSHGDRKEQRTLTRELLERAVSTAFDGLLQDSTLDASSFPDYHKSQSSERSSVGDKENTPPPVNPATKTEAKLCSTLEEMATLSATHRQRQREHAEALQHSAENMQSVRTFNLRMKHAAFEHRERKLAVQALQARIQCEMQYLAAIAVDLEKREFLLDDAFESYEHALRVELGLVASPRSPCQ